MQVLAEVSPDVQLVGTGLGDFGGAAQIQQLQQALKGLAQASGWTAVDPGFVTGAVNPQTISALTNVIPALAREAGLSSRTAEIVSVALRLAQSSPQLQAAANTAVATNAGYITPAVLVLTAKYTRAPAPPPPIPSPVSPQVPFVVPMMRMAVTTPTVKPLPVGAIQTRSKTGMFRVAIPARAAAGLGGPAVSLGEAFFELPPRTFATTGVQTVSETEFDRKTGAAPFYKRPLYWAIAGGVAIAAGTGAYFLLRG